VCKSFQWLLYPGTRTMSRRERPTGDRHRTWAASGHRRRDTAGTARWQSGVTRRSHRNVGSNRHRSAERTVKTGVGAVRRTRSATLPSKSRSTPRRPCVPTDRDEVRTHIGSFRADLSSGRADQYLGFDVVRSGRSGGRFGVVDDRFRGGFELGFDSLVGATTGVTSMTERTWIVAWGTRTRPRVSRQPDCVRFHPHQRRSFGRDT